jgi:hypothetical protein
MNIVKKSELEGVLKTLEILMGKPPKTYSLDNYHGWKIVEIVKGGGQKEPFGCKRRKASDMMSAMQFAILALEGAKK